MKTKGKKLVLFDLDGTLIRTLRPIDNLQRFRTSIQKVFHVDVGAFTEERWRQSRYNGRGDRYILWDLMKSHGVSRDSFVDHIGDIGDAFVEYLEGIADGGPSYAGIPEAKQLVEKVIKAEHLSEGILTGNLWQTAGWKLRSTGFPDIAFGVFGHEADNRNDLARLIIPKAEVYFGRSFRPSDVYIVGDTVYDVECARAIGATVIIVATGWKITKEEFAALPPDLHVDTLMDEPVLKLLGLK